MQIPRLGIQLQRVVDPALHREHQAEKQIGIRKVVKIPDEPFELRFRFVEPALVDAGGGQCRPCLVKAAVDLQRALEEPYRIGAGPILRCQHT